jgi:high affinity sulfate transporter 1
VNSRTASAVVHERDRLRWLPAVRHYRRYERQWLARDVTAGITLVALLAPTGMAYAQASGLPPINGLYATIVPLLVYAIVGPSRVLVMGPDSSLAPLIAAAVATIATNPTEVVAVAGLLAIFVGVIGVVAGLARMGFLADLLSAPVRYGFLNGIALTIIVGQLPKAFGFSVDAETLLGRLRGFARHAIDGDTNGWALAIAAMSLAVIVVLHLIAPRVPAMLVAVAAAIALTLSFGLADKDVALVGQLAHGLPAVHFPQLSWERLTAMTGAAFGIAFVAFADTSVLARTYAIRRGEKVDANQELIALGLVNIAAGISQGFPVSGSQSRTPVAESAGARTQLTGIVAALALLAVILAAPGAFANLPQAALAAVMIGAAFRIVTVAPVVRLARARRSEFLLAVAAFLGVAVLGAIVGVIAAIALSLLNFMRKAWKPHTAELVRVDGLKGYHDSERHPEGRRVPGLLLYRFDAPLFFANARYFAQDVLDRINQSTAPVSVVIVTAAPITDVDATAAETVAELQRDLAALGISLRFAELKGHVRERMDAFGLVDLLGAQWFARTTGEAVRTYVAGAEVPWTDWEDRG